MPSAAPDEAQSVQARLASEKARRDGFGFDGAEESSETTLRISGACLSFIHERIGSVSRAFDSPSASIYQCGNDLRLRHSIGTEVPPD